MTPPRQNCLPGLLASLLAFTLFLIPAAPAPLVYAQQGGGPIRVESNLVLVEATVKDKTGRVIDGLTAKDFELREDGVPQTISHFSRDQLPLAVALVVDLSTSIQPFLRPLRYATQTALRSLKPEDEVALFTFTGRVERNVELTRDKRSISDQIQYLTAGGATNINGAIYEAANYLHEQSPAARRVIILVSDNVPTDEGGVPARQVEDAVLGADSPVYSLKIPGENPAEARLAAKFGGKVNVSRLAADTGGEVFDVEKEGSLYLAFEALIERLKTRYTLGYAPGHEVRDGKFHALQVHLAASHGTFGKDYTVLAKRGYFASATRISGTP
jgi:Ca-activated chloride channel homolog